MNAYKRLEYSPFDILIVLSGIICIMAGTYFFNSSLFQSDDFRETETFGFISHGEGTRKLGNSLQWFDITKKSELFYGDVIFANEDKDIEIELLDKESKLIVPEDSMIRITKSGDEFNLDVSKGSVVIKTKSIRKINLRDKRGKVRKLTISKNSNVKISSKKSNVIVEAIKGRASITKTNSKKKLEIKKGKVLVVGPKETKVLNKTRLIQSKEVDPLFATKILLREKHKNIKILELSKKDDFKKIRLIQVIEGSFGIKKLNYGQYFVREPKKFSFDSFTVKKLKPITIQMAKKEKYYEGEQIKINWSGRSELMYRLQIGGVKPINKLVQGNEFIYTVKDAGEIPVILTEQKFERTVKTKILINISKDLDVFGLEQISKNGKDARRVMLKNPRQISYRIKVVNESGKIFVNRKTKLEEYPINITKPGKYKVQLLNLLTKAEYFNSEFVIADKILNNRTKKSLVSTRNEVFLKLKWKRQSKFPKDIKYTVKIYDEKKAITPILEKTLSKNQFNFKVKKMGTFYWKVESSLPAELKGSELTSITVRRPELVKVNSPKIVLKYLDEGDCYQFSLPKHKLAKMYDTYIYSSRTKIKGTWKTTYHKRIKTNKDCIKSKAEGKYYYKYRIEDKWNRKSPFSDLGTIFFPISPLDDF